jgi:MFS superfamily sulfate permease-like transporter
MAGCAMIGQSIINIKSGGRGRLSAASDGAFLLIMVVGLGDLVSIIPMPALVAIMIMVPIGTFSLVVDRQSAHASAVEFDGDDRDGGDGGLYP